MIQTENARYYINIFLHVCILFAFLTIFFFAYISRLTTENINSALSGMIEQQVQTFLTEVDQWDKKILPGSYPTIIWKEVDNIAKKIYDNSEGTLPSITTNNNRLKIIAISAVAGLFLLLIGMYVYFQYVLGLDINIGHIITENILIFILIGFIEVFFFIKIAANYIPTTPDFVESTVLDRIKYQLTKNLVKDSPQ